MGSSRTLHSTNQSYPNLPTPDSTIPWNAEDLVEALHHFSNDLLTFPTFASNTVRYLLGKTTDPNQMRSYLYRTAAVHQFIRSNSDQVIEILDTYLSPSHQISNDIHSGFAPTLIQLLAEMPYNFDISNPNGPATFDTDLIFQHLTNSMN